MKNKHGTTGSGTVGRGLQSEDAVVVFARSCGSVCNKPSTHTINMLSPGILLRLSAYPPSACVLFPVRGGPSSSWGVASSDEMEALRRRTCRACMMAASCASGARFLSLSLSLSEEEEEEGLFRANAVNEEEKGPVVDWPILFS